MQTNEQPARRRPVLAPIPARRGRRTLRPFYPTRRDGPFQVPAMLLDRAGADFERFGNREEMWRLLVWLLASNRRGLSFPIDRRAVAACASTGLTESQVRTAARNLVTEGYLERLVPIGEGGFKHDASGRPYARKAILYRFGSIVAECFTARAPARRQLHEIKSPKAGLPAPGNRFRGFEGVPSPVGVPLKRHSKPEGRWRSAPDPEALAFLQRPPEPLPLASPAIKAFWNRRRW